MPASLESRRPATHGLAVAAFVLVGCAQLTSRAWLGPITPPARAGLYAIVFVAMLVGSMIVPAVQMRSDAGPVALVTGSGAGRLALVAGLGIAAVGLAAVASGTPVPFPAAAWTLPLSLLAAVAEEALFRRVAFGHLLRWGPLVAVVGAAVLFAIVHVPLYGVAALPVDLGAGLVFGWQRWASGSWAVPAATHAVANVVAVLR